MYKSYRWKKIEIEIKSNLNKDKYILKFKSFIFIAIFNDSKFADKTITFLNR